MRKGIIRVLGALAFILAVVATLSGCGRSTTTDQPAASNGERLGNDVLAGVKVVTLLTIVESRDQSIGIGPSCGSPPMK